ncbi:hypothetical protein [Terrimonas pollutisoli]|uniref:hypothetical protein n=1 Tax=Terrimonas pollutisoli TaxID=3034147 RepID=UPI0023EC7FF4|nr:hypothetical protein [Terrimonas sp. H1YJ31]
MNKVTKYLLISTLTLGLLIAIFYSLGLLAFSGAFDKKYSRQELTDSFLEHENEFLDVDRYFKSTIPPNISYSVTFGLSARKRVSLYLHPFVIDPANKIIGGKAMSVESPKLDSALKVLGWSKETIITLQNKLAKTNCDWIRTVDYSDQIQMYPNQNGWGSFTYSIWNTPISDSLIKDYGQPITNNGFGQFVTLNYSSAL